MDENYLCNLLTSATNLESLFEKRLTLEVVHKLDTCGYPTAAKLMAFVLFEHMQVLINEYLPAVHRYKPDHQLNNYNLVDQYLCQTFHFLSETIVQGVPHTLYQFHHFKMRTKNENIIKTKKKS